MADTSKKTATVETPTVKVGVGVLVVLISGLIVYCGSQVDRLRMARLAFVNEQIEKLYGPLYSLTQANDRTWEYFTKKYFPDRNPIFALPPAPPLPLEKVDIWRAWMTTVFQPFNVKIDTAIVNNAQLVMGGEIPSVFQEFIIHTESYKAVVSNWKPTDRTNFTEYVKPENNVGAFNYPSDIIQCARVSYQTLQIRKQALEKFWNLKATFSSEPASDCVCSFRINEKQIEKTKNCPNYEPSKNPIAIEPLIQMPL